MPSGPCVASSDAVAASAVSSCSTDTSRCPYAASRRVEASAERTRSTALRWTIVSSHEIALPLVSSNRAA